MKTRTRLLTAALVAAALLPVSSHHTDPAPPATVAAPVAGPAVVEPKAPPGTPDLSVARSRFAELVVDDRPPPAGYTRDGFDPHSWSDLDRDGCSTREDVMAHWLGTPLLGGMCDASGTMPDPYTGHAMVVPGQVDIDHVVSLLDAWRAGAATWSAAARESYYNDERNLVPTTAHVNRAKGSRGPDQWMPPDAGYRCTYAKIYVGVKHVYRLSITSAQRAALGAALDRCPVAPGTATSAR